ncbi:MAG TPA: SDR family oxidoreductase [Kofleriaceae bacterium]|nr:SDR family oxidoreductase [Kofleriaceae bacterium]
MSATSTAVVTGAARGLGRLIAEALAGRGYQVLCTDVDGAGAEATARAIGPSAWGLAQDVRDPDSHRRIAAAATARAPLAVWVNNAGVLHVGAAWEATEAEVRRMVDVNLLGVVWGSQAAVAAMPQGGHLINVASLSAYVPAPGLAVYAATKAAVVGFTTALAGDLQRARIPVHACAICPDAVHTDMVKQVAHHDASDILFSAGRMLRAEDVAAAVLASLDRPRLIRILPPSRGALAHALHPFPALGLRLLEGFAALGHRRKAKRV